VDASAVQFGAVLREARRKKGLSQVELGDGKYSGSYISHLESGRRVATPEVVEFVSRRLGVSLLEWGVSAKADGLQALRDPLEDLLVAERAWSDHDWAAALRHAMQAAEAAVAAGDLGREWESRYVMAQAMFSSGDFVGAAEVAEALAEHPTAHRFSVARSQALSLASISHRAADHLGWAVAYGARAVEASSSAPPIIAAEALMSLVSAMSEAGHSPDESERYLRRLGELAPQLTSDHSRGMIAWAMGTAEFAAGDAASGIAHHQQAKDLLDPRRDLRLWLRFHRSAASCLLGAGIIEGVAELVRTAALGLEILGNTYDLVELRQVQAQLALHSGEPQEALRITSEVLADPVMGAPSLSRSNTELLRAEALLALGREDEARLQFRGAAESLEHEGRMRAAVKAWKQSFGEGEPKIIDKDLTPSSQV
jgi:transcriptional regulator with XRE-family HTH domain